MLVVTNVYFKYDNQNVIRNVSFSLEKGKNLAIIGESGCGKSTLLKLIYGLYDTDEGTIFWNKSQILGPKFNLVPGMDYMKYLAQDFDLMPYIIVAENVGKYLSNFYPEKKKERVNELLNTVEMTEYANTKAQFLSGGQMQRVALAKVLALEPEILLLDEPFSHIDNFRKTILRRKLFAYLKQKNITTIIATHDSNDVLSFCDEVLVMQNGKIIEQGCPKQLYENTQNTYTASLFDEVNQMVINNKTHILYPNQLQKTEFSNIKTVVVKSYYRGNYYLVEAKFKEQNIYFNNADELHESETIYLEIIK